MGAISDLASFNPMLKDQYLMGGVKKQLNEKTVLLSWIEKTSDYIDSTGRRAIFPTLIGFPGGVGSRAEMAPTPRPKPSKTKAGEVDLSYQYATLGFSGVALEKATGDKGAFADMLTFEMDNIVPYIRRDLNRQVIAGAGAGNITRISQASNTTGLTITVDSTINLYDNMDIDVYTIGTDPLFTDATLAYANVTIMAVDDNAGTITTNTAIATASPSISYIFRAGSIGTDCMGLPGIVDDGSLLTVLEGISRVTTPRWKGKVFNNSKSATTISDKILQPGYSAIEKTGEDIKFALTSYELRDYLAGTYFTQKQFKDDQAYKIRAGFKYLEMNGLPVGVDEQLTASGGVGTASGTTQDRFYFLVPKTLAIHQTSEMKWDELAGTILNKVPGVHAYEAMMYWFMQFVCYRPNANAVVTYLKNS